MMGGIFISYRREDTQHAAGRLVDCLSLTFGTDQLFFDIDTIEPGLDFKKVVSQKVQACDVLLAVIGTNWLSSSDQAGARRLDNPKDYVRIEIEAALARDIRVIPVLIDAALMPSDDDLPDTLRSLTNRNAVRLVHERFASDAVGLTQALAKVVKPSIIANIESPSARPQSPSDWHASYASRNWGSFVLLLTRGSEQHYVHASFDVRVFSENKTIIDYKERKYHILGKNEFRIQGHPEVFKITVLEGFLGRLKSSIG
jgi:hypothetical protein